MLERAAKSGVDRTAPHAFITKQAATASGLLIQVDAEFGENLSASQKVKWEQCLALMMELAKYDVKANSGSRTVPTWNGEPLTLRRHLQKLDYCTEGIEQEENKLLFLERSLPKMSKDLINHCVSYADAREFLQKMAHNPQAVAVNMRSKMMSLTPAETNVEEDLNIQSSVKYLGAALQAQPLFDLAHVDAVRFLLCMTTNSMPTHLAKLETMLTEEIKKQGIDAPNLARPMYEYLERLKNSYQLHHAATQMDPRVNRNSANVRPAHLTGPAGGGGGNVNPPAGAGAGGGPSTKVKNKLCPFCKTTWHKEGHMWQCAELFLFVKNKRELPPQMCECCMMLPKSDKCKASTCCDTLSRSGTPLDFRCKVCKVHRNIGKCAGCLEGATKRREKTLTWMKKGMDGKRGNQIHVRAAALSTSRLVVNECVLGAALTPCEVIEAILPSGEVIKISVLYDSQAEITLMSPTLFDLCSPRRHHDPLTIHGVGANITYDHTDKGTIVLLGENGNEFKVEGLIQDHPPAKAKKIFLPHKWFRMKTKNLFAEQVAEAPTPYSILLGAEVSFHPLPVIGNNGLQESIGSLRLLKSQVTGKFLCSGIVSKDVYPGMDDTDGSTGLHVTAARAVIHIDCTQEDDTSEDTLDEGSTDAEIQLESEDDVSENESSQPSEDVLGAVGVACRKTSATFDSSIQEDQVSGKCQATHDSEDCKACASVRINLQERSDGRATWLLGKEVGDEGPKAGEAIEEHRLRAEQMVTYLKGEIEGLESIATGCRGCCPRINELASMELNFARRLKESLQLLDDTDPHHPDDDKVPSHAAMLADPPWDHEPGDPKAEYPRLKQGRKKKRILLKRIMRAPADQCHNFMPEAQAATRRIVKQLTHKPKAVAEISYKIKKEIDDGVMFTLEDYLKRPEVIEAGVTAENVDEYTMFAGLLFVYKDSPNTPCRLVFNPAQKKRGTNETVNQNIGFSGSLVAKLLPTYLRMAFTPHWCAGDLEGFYLKTRLDVFGVLMNCIFLQKGEDGKPCLTGDESLPMIKCCKLAPCFGAQDAGCHAQLALMSSPDLYRQHFPEGPDKLPDHLIDSVKGDIKASFVDDMAIAVSLRELQDEMKDMPPARTAEESIERWEKTGKKVLERKVWVATDLVDKLGYAFKSFSVPADKKLEDQMNKNPLMLCSRPKLPRDASRPASKEVIMESSGGKRHEIEPRPEEENPPYLGISIDRQDRVSLKSRDLTICKKRAGVVNPEKTFRTLEKIEAYLEHSTFNMREFLAYLSLDYDPTGKLNGMSRFVGKSIFKLVHLSLSRPGQDQIRKWNEKTPVHLKPLVKKYFKLFEMTCEKKVDRYAFVRCPLEDLRVGFMAMTDGADESGGELIYAKSRNIKTGETKVSLLMAGSKQAPVAGRSIPNMELDAASRGMYYLKMVVTQYLEDGFPADQVDFVLLIIDSQSTIYMVRQHAGTLKTGFKKQVARIQVDFVELERLFDRPGFPNIYENIVWIDQFHKIGPDKVVGTNFSDYLTKVDLFNQGPEEWMEKWDEIHDGGWVNLDMKHWTHLHKGSGGHPADENHLNFRPAHCQTKKIRKPKSHKTKKVTFKQTVESSEDVIFGASALGQEGYSWKPDPRYTAPEVMRHHREIRRPKDEDPDVVWERYYSALDDKRYADLPQNKTYQAYYNPYYHSSNIFKFYGKEAADAFLQDEENGRRDHWDPALAPGVRVRAAQVQNEALETGVDPMFFTKALRVGQVNPERLRSLTEGSINTGKLRSMCQVTGMVVCLAKKWRKKSADRVAKEAIDKEMGAEKANIEEVVVESEAGERAAIKEAVAEEVTVEEAVAEEAVAEEVVAEEMITEEVVTEKMITEEVVAGAASAELAVAKEENAEGADGEIPKADVEDEGDPEAKQWRWRWDGGTMPNHPGSPGLEMDPTAEAEEPGLPEEPESVPETDPYMDITGYEGRDERERVGLWILVGESAGQLDEGAAQSRHRLISNLLPSQVTFKNKRISVLVGRNMRVFNNPHLNLLDDGSSPFFLRVLSPSKPLARHVTHAAHNAMGCALSKNTYRDEILREGFYWPTMLKTCEEFREECPSCIIQHAAMRKQSDAVQAPGPDYTVRETLQDDPLSVVIIDETGPTKFTNGETGYGLMVVELMSGRVILLGIPSTKTVDLVDALERLQAIRGGLQTIILDAAPSHQVIANATSTTSGGEFLRKKLNTKNVRKKLGEMGVRVKMAGAAAHHQAGRAENVSKNLKAFKLNVCHGMDIRDGLHFQSLLDKMAGVFNNRVKFLDPEGCVHTSNTFLQAAAYVSRVEPQDLSRLINTKSKKISYDVRTVADETRRITTIFASHYMHRLAAWQVQKFGKQPQVLVGDVVIVTDKILLHHYRSARRAIGRVLAISISGQSFNIRMVSRGKGDPRPDVVKHRKHLLLLARCKDNQGKVTHIDPLEDGQVSELMGKDRMSLKSEFFSSGLERLPCIQDVNEAVREFEDPDDLELEADISRPPTAADLFNTRSVIAKEVAVKPDEPEKKKATAKSSLISQEIKEKAAPAFTSRSGRESRPPTRFGV
jgi:hypothetical protein